MSGQDSRSVASATPDPSHRHTRGLGQEIAQHLADLEGANGEKAKATGLREKGRADFVATLKETAG